MLFEAILIACREVKDKIERIKIERGKDAI